MRDSTKELIALMQQENGVTEFQWAFISGEEWRDCNNPLAPVWDSPRTKFRVKPKPVEGWAWKYPSNTLGAVAHLYNEKQPDDISGTDRVMVLLREVTK